VPISFGDFVLDSSRRELRRGALPARISPKALQLLELLVAERSRAVSRDEIHARLWQGVSVSGASVARLVNEVRAALGDDARRPRYVRTVHGFGYAFVDPPADEAPWPGSSSCRLASGRRRFPLLAGENVLGRAPDVEVMIESTRASRRHARIVVAGDRVTLEDLRSRNGTFLNGLRIEAATDLSDGDTIEIGPVAMVFERTPSRLDTTESG
jgi:DNA-binding winged helix-turn-helix (wHTH) protein